MLRFAIAAAALVMGLPASVLAQTVDQLVARNVAARGGAKAWRAVASLQLAGRMEIGKAVTVPYVLDQKRPDKMRLEFVFDEQTAVQAYDGKAGWKFEPFRNRTHAQPMNEAELREAAGTSDPRGLLVDYARRGHKIELQGREKIDGRDAHKLKVTLPGGAVRWVYLDAKTGLEIKVESLRKLGRRERRVATFYQDWRAQEGLLIPRRLETRTEGRAEPLTLTVQTVRVNLPLEDSRFAMPAGPLAAAQKGK